MICNLRKGCTLDAILRKQGLGSFGILTRCNRWHVRTDFAIARRLAGKEFLFRTLCEKFFLLFVVGLF